MQGIYQTLALLSGKPAQFRGEDVLDLGPAGRISPPPVAGQLIGERLVDARRAPGGSHLLQHPSTLGDERLDPRRQRLILVNPGDQRALDLPVAPDRLDQQCLSVGELLPHGSQRNAGPRGDPGDGGAKVPLGVQGSHRLQDRPAGAVRACRATVRRLDVVDLVQIGVCAQQAIDMHQVILR